MIGLLGRDGRHLLRALAGSESLLAFDFDGTLAPIVADRRRAAMRPRTRALLGRVCARYPCAVISGRARVDVAQRLSGVGVRYVIGNHGLEDRDDARAEDQVARKDLRRMHRALKGALRGQRGIDVEDKRVTLAVHYRHASDRARARERILEVLEARPGSVRVIGGDHVINVLPAQERDKGTALTHLWDLVGADTALYIGDDDTDELAFRVSAQRPLVAARIGARPRSAAGCFLASQADIDKLLEILLVMRGAVP